MNQQTNIFLEIEDQTGALAGEWYQVPRTDRTHIPVAISILNAGTCTWAIQGRNTPADDPVELETGTTDDAVSVLRMAQMRVILSDAAAVDFRATSDLPMREIEEL